MTYRVGRAVTAGNNKAYAYDACGNMTTRGSQTLDYDEENQLFSVTDTGLAITYGYANGGSRLWKMSDSTIKNIWIGGIYEIRNPGANQEILCHVMAEQGMVATFTPDPGTTGTYQYYHSDHLGSSSIMTDYQGVQAQKYGYKAFGDDRYELDSTPDFDPLHRFTGQMLDKDTGLYYYNARYYDPQLARFVQPDSIIPGGPTSSSQSLNRYSYCFNNPLIFRDPSGNGPTYFEMSSMYQSDIMNSGTNNMFGDVLSSWTNMSLDLNISLSPNGANALSSSLSGAIDFSSFSLYDDNQSNLTSLSYRDSSFSWMHSESISSIRNQLTMLEGIDVNAPLFTNNQYPELDWLDKTSSYAESVLIWTRMITTIGPTQNYYGNGSVQAQEASTFKGVNDVREVFNAINRNLGSNIQQLGPIEINATEVDEEGRFLTSKNGTYFGLSSYNVSIKQHPEYPNYQLVTVTDVHSMSSLSGWGPLCVYNGGGWKKYKDALNYNRFEIVELPFGMSLFTPFPLPGGNTYTTIEWTEPLFYKGSD